MTGIQNFCDRHIFAKTNGEWKTQRNNVKAGRKDKLKFSQNLDIDIAPHNIERSHRIGQPRKPGEKQCPIIVKFVRYNDHNKIFRNKKKLKCKKMLITESLAAKRMEKLKEVPESYMVFICLDQQW